MNCFPLSARDEHMIVQRRNISQKTPNAASHRKCFEERSGKPDDFPVLSSRKPSPLENPGLRDDDGFIRRGPSYSPKPQFTRRRIGSKRMKQPFRSKSADNVFDDHLSGQNVESISDLAHVFSDHGFLNDERHNISFSSDHGYRREHLNSSFSSDTKRYERQNSSFSSEVSNPHYDRLHNSFSSTGSYNTAQLGLNKQQRDVQFVENSNTFETLPEIPGRLRVSSRDTPSKHSFLRQSSASSKEHSRSTLTTRTSFESHSKSSHGSNDLDRDCPPRERLARNNSSESALSKSSSSESHGCKTARRSRRPKASSNVFSSESLQPTPQSTSEKRSVRHSTKNREEFLNRGKKKENYLNRSFNWSFSSVNEPVSFVPNEDTGYDAAVMTPSLGSKPFLSSLNFEIPSHSTRVSHNDLPCDDNLIQPIRDAISIVDDLGSLTLDEASEAKLTLYDYARRYEWDLVFEECQHSPWTAKYVSQEDGTTALHLAVMSRANPQIRDGAHDGLKAASLHLIEQLILACPESAIIRCTLKKYTPLCYACLVADKGYDMEDSAQMIRIILKHSPHSALVFTDECFSALDVHIISYSRLFQEKEEVHSRNGRSSTVVLRTLLQESPSLAMSRSYGNRVRGPVELLYRCNLNEFKEASGQEVVTIVNRTPKKKTATGSVLSTLSQWWAWKWTLILLEVSSLFEASDATAEEDNTPFWAVHAASQLEGCPVPILALAVDAFPDQVKMRNPRKGLNNCPLHDVCGWISDASCITGDPVIVKRKRKAITLLLEAFPKAARMTNNLGETPLHLAIETCSPWESLEELVRMFPTALTIPRNIENCREDSPLFKAMAFHNDDLGSVGSDEWEPDAIDAIQGMYPFMVAAVLSHVPDRRVNGSSIILDYSKDRDKTEKGLRQKDLASLQSIYGLLRAKPLALDLFREDEKARVVVSGGDGKEDKDETETEAFLEEDGASEYTEEDVSIEIHSEYTEEEVE